MSFCTEEIYSHPNKKLKIHLENVANRSKCIFEKMNIENNILFSEISFLIGLAHDFAKSTSFFQDHLINDKEGKETYHSFLSAVFGYYVLKEYITKNNIENNNLSIIGYLCIVNHHNNLKDVYYTDNDNKYSEWNKLVNSENIKYAKIQIEDLEKRNMDKLIKFYKKYDISVKDFFDKFDDLIEDIEEDLSEICDDENIDNFLILLLFFSVLIDSDKFDASQTEEIQRISLNSNMVDNYKENKFSKDSKENSINKIRNKAYNSLNNSIKNINLEDKIFSLTLPTGSGKTLTAFSFALKLREKIEEEYDIQPRIIYSLPFLSIIDQNEKVIYDILENSDFFLKTNDDSDCPVTTNIFMKYTSTSDLNYITNEMRELNLNQSDILLGGWYSEIIITTFYQIFYSIFSNKNKSLRKFHNIVNSIIILDEVQSIPIRYWLLVNKILKRISIKYNTWFIFMTATQPAIFEKEDIKPLIEDESMYFRYFDRINYVFHKDEIDIEDFKQELVKKINEDKKDIMIVLNTINSSKDVYDYIRENLDDDLSELYYLSTNIVPKQRLERIHKIKNSQKRKIIVTTQLIEAGVDIDVDIIYRDFTVIDNIIQTAGRCNRNNQKQKGEVHIVKLDKNGRKDYEIIYDPILLKLTDEILSNYTIVSEKEFNTNVIKEYFNEAKKREKTDDSEKIIESIENLKLLNMDQFKLINQNIQKEDVFIELDLEAKKIWETYSLLKGEEYDNEELIKTRNKLNNYIISVYAKDLEKITFENEIYYVANDELNEKYDEQTGFFHDKDGALIF